MDLRASLSCWASARAVASRIFADCSVDRLIVQSNSRGNDDDASENDIRHSGGRPEQSRAAAAVRSTYDAAAGYTNSVASKCEQCVRLLGLALVFSL